MKRYKPIQETDRGNREVFRGLIFKNLFILKEEKEIMRKTFLAVALATAMVVTAVPTLPVSADTATTAEAGEATVINIDKNIGTSDLSTAWWTAFSDYYKIESGAKYEFNFDVYGGDNNWNNFAMCFSNVAALSAAENADYIEYAVVRNDNWGWGGGDNKSLSGDDMVYSNSLAEAMTDAEWATFKEIFKKANVKLEIERDGKNINITSNVKSKDDETKSFVYKASFVAADAAGTEAGDVYLKLVVDGSMIAPASDDSISITKDITTRAVTLSAGDTRVSIPFVSKVEGVKATFKVNDGKEIEGKLSSTGMSVAADVGTLKAGDKVTVTITGEGYNDKVINLTVEAAPTTKKAVKINKVTAKKGATKVTGTVSVAKATVKVKVGKKAYKAAKVTGKKFTLKVAKLKKGTKVVVKATKKNYKTATKTVTVK